jgi:hypothetical protein
LTAVISDSGLGLQPVAEKRESVRTKSNSDLHLIAVCLSFQVFADPVVLLSLFRKTMLWNNPWELPALNTESFS